MATTSMCPTGAHPIILEIVEQPPALSANAFTVIRCKECGTVVGGYDTIVLAALIKRAVKDATGR